MGRASNKRLEASGMQWLGPTGEKKLDDGMSSTGPGAKLVVRKRKRKLSLWLTLRKLRWSCCSSIVRGSLVLAKEAYFFKERKGVS